MRKIDVYLNPSDTFLTSDFIELIQTDGEFLILDRNKEFLDSVQRHFFKSDYISPKLSLISVDITSTNRAREFFDILSRYQSEICYAFHVQIDSPLTEEIISRISQGHFKLVNPKAGPSFNEKGTTAATEAFNHVGVLLIQFDAYSLTRECIISLLQTSGDKKLYLLDNASADFSALELFLEFPSIVIISPQYRISYCLAFNILADYSIRKGANYLFITNNDTKDFSRDIFGVLVANLSKEIGMVSPRILDFTNENIHWRPRTKLGIQFDIATEAYLVASKTWLKLDGFLNSFVMYFEDLNFLMRLRAFGLDGTLDTGITMAHLGGGAVGTKIFVPTFFSLRNSLWILRMSTGKRFSNVLFKFFWLRARTQILISISDLKKGLYFDAIRRVIYIFLAFGIGLTTMPSPNRPRDLEMAFQQERTQFKFRLK